jgi:DNA-binding protein H-NS
MTYDELVAQRAELDKQIKDMSAAARQEAIAAARDLIAKFALTDKELRTSPHANKGKPVAPKYRDVETGKEWSGRGFRPAWLKGKDLADYLIA